MKDHEDNHHKQETKFENFGYATRILVGASTNGKTNTRELAASLHIFSHPTGAKFELTKPKSRPYGTIPLSFAKFRNILSVTELAGLIHLPTIYVKTPGLNWVTTRKFEPPHNLPKMEAPNTPIGISNFR